MERPASVGPDGSDQRSVMARFKQQQLPAWQPILTPLPVIVTFFCVALVFLPIGIALLLASNSVIEVSSRYDDVVGCTALNGTNCTITIPNVPAMQPPVFVYYRLDNFYQNHRRYARSRSDSQLSGTYLTSSGDFASCDPAKCTNENDPSTWYIPCGLTATSVFNDSFTITDGSGAPLSISSTGIAWKSDVDRKFKNPQPNATTGLPPTGNYILNPVLFPKNIEDERFIVWMRLSALPEFRKLWGRIDTPVAAGSLTVSVTNNFPVQSFAGRKYIIMSTTSWAGGKNNFLGVAYIVVGSLSAAVGIILLLLSKLKPRKLGDPAYLRWK